MKRDRPSSTARKVALSIISLGAKPEMEEVLPDGIVDATARLLVAAEVVGEGAVRFARSRFAVAIYEAFDWMMPGQFEAFAHRKAFCEQTVRDGIAAGAMQVLVLGAGYDTLGWRLAPEFPGVRFFEIDHPATGERKAQGIAGLGRRENLHLIQADLASRSLVDVLCTMHVDAIYSSPHRRAVATVAPFASTVGHEVRIEPALRELALTDWWLEDPAHWRSLVDRVWRDFEWVPPGGESASACQARMVGCVERLRRAHRGEVLLLSSHGQAIGCYLRHIDGSFDREHWAMLSMPDLVSVDDASAAPRWRSVLS